MVSIVISSKTPLLLQQVSENIKETIGVDFEIIAIANPNGEISICKAYNEGAEKAKYPYLCFCHEDILFTSQNWGKKQIDYLKNKEIGLIGVSGSCIKPLTPSGVWLNNYKTDRFYIVQRGAEKEDYLKYSNPNAEIKAEVKIIDGLFMACRKEVWEINKFDDKIFTGFHGYDIDFSLQIQKKHKLFVIYDIELIHFSGGGNSINWINDMRKIKNKWKHSLPSSTIHFSSKEIKTIEYDALNYFVRSMISAKYNLYLTLGYLVRLFFLKPLEFNNLRVIKYLIKNGKY